MPIKHEFQSNQKTQQRYAKIQRINSKITAYLVDLDSTFFLYGTNELAPGSHELAEKIKAEGGQLFCATARKKNNPAEALNIESTQNALKQLKIDYEAIIEDCESPRVLINDEGAFSFNVITNKGLRTLEVDSLLPAIQRIHNSLVGLAWSNAKYGDENDADDFVQTILVAESLLENQSFDHTNLANKFRQEHRTTMHGKKLSAKEVSSLPTKGRFLNCCSAKTLTTKLLMEFLMEQP